MIEYCKMIEQQDAQEEKRLIKERSGYKLAKGHDYGNHQIIQAIGYAEFNTNKLNGQRPMDRPYGNAEGEHWVNKTTGAITYGSATAEAWAKEGAEVYHYNARNVLVEVINSSRKTRKKYAGVRIK